MKPRDDHWIFHHGRMQKFHREVALELWVVNFYNPSHSPNTKCSNDLEMGLRVMRRENVIAVITGWCLHCIEWRQLCL